MKISYIYLLLTLNFVTTVVAYYKKCYEEFSVCLITNTDDISSESRFRLSRASAYDWCKRKSSSLAVVTNATVQSAIEAFIKDSSAKLDSDVIANGYRYGFPFNNWEWIGRRRSANNPSSERSDYRYGYLLVSAGRGVTLNASIPTTSRNFICSYLSYNSSCPNEHRQLGSSCYKIHSSEAATWFDARNLCLQAGYDLATFVDVNSYIDISKGWLGNGEYWIGLWKEFWNWIPGYVEIKYSNWDTYRPNPTGGNCLCLKANTGKWKDCDCNQKHRYICIEDYTPDSSTAPTTARITTSTTKADGQPTLTTIVDGSYKQPDDSEDSGKKNNDSQRLIIWIPLAILIILIVVVAAWIVVKKYYKRNNEPMLDGESSKNKTNQSPSSVDEYATMMPETSTENRTYAQLQLYEPFGDETK